MHLTTPQGSAATLPVPLTKRFRVLRSRVAHIECMRDGVAAVSKCGRQFYTSDTISQPSAATPTCGLCVVAR